MSLRYKGARLSATPPTTSMTSAPGLWTLRQYLQAVGWPIAPSQQAFTTPGTHTWIAPDKVTSICVVCVGGGATSVGGMGINLAGGGAGGLGWKNNIAVTPGQSYTVVVGAGGSTNSVAPQNGGNSYFISLATVAGYGGSGNSGGTYAGDGGGNGGGGSAFGAGGGAGGYSGNGGNAGGSSGVFAGGSGGGAASGVPDGSIGGGSGGGGVGILGQGASGTSYAGQGGSGGSDANNSSLGTPGAAYGGGGGTTAGGNGNYIGGGNGAVRIIWGAGRAFPSTNTGNL